MVSCVVQTLILVLEFRCDSPAFDGSMNFQSQGYVAILLGAGSSYILAS